MNVRAIYFLLAFSLFGFGMTGDITFKQIKEQYLGKDVYIIGSCVMGNKLSLWEKAEGDSVSGYREVQDISNRLVPYSLKGTKARIISITISGKSSDGQQKDLFDENINNDNVIDPSVHVIAKLYNLDSTLLITSTSGTFIKFVVQLAPNTEYIRKVFSIKKDSLIGKVIYPTSFSYIYPPDADMSMLTEVSKRSNRLLDVPNLTPLKITNAKYIESENAIIYKVAFKGNLSDSTIERTGIIYCPWNESNYNLDSSFLRLAVSGFELKVPKGFNAYELKAIKNNTVCKGMGMKALWISIGMPESNNDWGEGGKQLIYHNGSLMIYTKHDSVCDWQIMDNK